MTLAQRMHRRLIHVLCQLKGMAWASCWGDRCVAIYDLEIDHPTGRKPSDRNRNPKHRRKSYPARVRDYWLAFARGEPLRVLCRSCNARSGGGRRYT